MNPFDPERGDLSFLEANAGNERKRWACPKCGDIISSHNGICLQCGKGATDRKMTKTKQTISHNGMVDLPTLKRTNTSMKPE
jgi:ribosomal protein S27AE